MNRKGSQKNADRVIKRRNFRVKLPPHPPSLSPGYTITKKIRIALEPIVQNDHVTSNTNTVFQHEPYQVSVARSGNFAGEGIYRNYVDFAITVNSINRAISANFGTVAGNIAERIVPVFMIHKVSVYCDLDPVSNGGEPHMRTTEVQLSYPGLTPVQLGTINTTLNRNRVVRNVSRQSPGFSVSVPPVWRHVVHPFPSISEIGFLIEFPAEKENVAENPQSSYPFTRVYVDFTVEFTNQYFPATSTSSVSDPLSTNQLEKEIEDMNC